MASINTGRATVFGGNGSVAIAGFASATFFTDTTTIEHNYEVSELRDEDNELRGIIHHGEVYRATLLLTPISASGSLDSLTSAKNSMVAPPKGAAVTLAGFKAPASGQIVNNSDWVYVGGWRLAFTRNGFATYELSIMRNPNHNISTATS